MTLLIHYSYSLLILNFYLPIKSVEVYFYDAAFEFIQLFLVLPGFEVTKTGYDRYDDLRAALEPL